MYFAAYAKPATSPSGASKALFDASAAQIQAR